eukprot:1160970-Pelagomonas_calceolata.AAC.10
MEGDGTQKVLSSRQLEQCNKLTGLKLEAYWNGKRNKSQTTESQLMCVTLDCYNFATPAGVEMNASTLELQLCLALAASSSADLGLVKALCGRKDATIKETWEEPAGSAFE